MGLRCSLLGHDFGDVVVERDRDVRGEEIVVTERELRECRRCDAESIITENTEVRRKRPKDAERDDSPAGGSDAAANTSSDADPTSEDATSLVGKAEESAAEREQADEDAIILDDTDSASDPAETPTTGESANETSATEGSADETSATEGSPADAGEATEFTGSSGAGPKQGPSEESDTPSEESDRPSADRDTATIDEDGMITAEEQEIPGTEEPAGAPEDRDGDGPPWHGDASSSEVQTDFPDSASDSKWPNDPDTADRSAQSDGDTGAGSVREPTDESEFEFADEDETEPDPGDPSSGIASAGPIDTTAPPDGGLEGTLRCPACDYAIPIARSANRPGDICPECHAGYLAEER
jgi:hypothetical protein